MTPTGYSGRPIAAKLGLKPGMRVHFRNEPANYLSVLGALPEDTDIRPRLTGTFDIIHLFTTKESHLRRELGKLRRALHPDGMLWVSWPKKTSTIPSQVSGDDVRRIVLAEGDQLVDVKVCAIDEDWSGLKFVVRREARGNRGRTNR